MSHLIHLPEYEDNVQLYNNVNLSELSPHVSVVKYDSPSVPSTGPTGSVLKIQRGVQYIQAECQRRKDAKKERVRRFQEEVKKRVEGRKEAAKRAERRRRAQVVRLTLNYIYAWELSILQAINVNTHIHTHSHTLTSVCNV